MIILTDHGLLKDICINNSQLNNIPDDIVVSTDSEIYHLSLIDCFVENNQYTYRTDNAEFIIIYREIEGTSFIVRSIKMRFKKNTTLLKIEVILPQADECFLYETFFNASAAVFQRNKGTGLCCGFENPFCILNGNSLYYEPCLILDKNVEYVCDLNFYGVYPLWGERISPCLSKTQILANGRYHPRYRNPSEGISLYYSEIQAFCSYTNNYFDVEKKKFKFMCYDFFGNMPQRPETEDEFNAYIEHIDAVKSIGCDTILLNPLYHNQLPTEDKNSYWNLFPEATYAEKIYDYAKKSGLKVGLYTGTAGNRQYGNSSMVNYADCKQWKKVNLFGNSGKENCLADDDFVNWYITVQKNTIKKFNLDVWDWDPGPGNAFFCYSNKHGHTPGKGAYKGFRNSLRVMREIKEMFPNLYYEGFHGNKEYGLWGFKYIDQHEAFWENEIYVMNPIYDDLSADRVTANNIRQQSVWNHYFRFMPETLNHGISHRMLQACWMKMTDVDLAFDYIGYRYALISAIAVGGSVTPTILPRKPQEIDGYVEFYNKWISLAKEIFPYSQNTIPFGSQVGCGIDAYSKIKDNEGYIFIFNPFPRNIKFDFLFDKRIGFEKSCDEFYTMLIYPYNQVRECLRYGKRATYIIPAYDCVVIKVSKRKFTLENDKLSKSLPRVLTENNNEVVFFADLKIKELIEEYNISQKAVSVMQEYSQRFNRVNNCWYRPDRLWLWICPEKFPDEGSISINGIKINPIQNELSHNELRAKNMLFADITEYVMWDKDNRICLSGIKAKDIYLHYAKPLNEEIPSTGSADLSVGNFAPVLDCGVNVLSASVNDNNVIIPNSENVLRAYINIPFEETEGVYASVPISIGNTGNELKRDMVLEFSDGCWKKTFKSGERLDLIIDDFKITVWAVSKDKKESEAYKLTINWLLE